MRFTFLSLLNASISASWLVLVVIALRVALKKAPKAIHCALWALVAFRLLCPISIKSNLSLVPSTETVSEYYLTQNGAMDTDPAVLDLVENPVYPENVDITLDTKSSRVSTLDVQWTAIIWPAGMAIMTAYALISFQRLRNKVSASISVAPDIRLCDYIDSPFILGIIRPQIYLPSNIDQASVDHVLAHERAHLARRDHWWKPLGFIILTIHWFNPVIWLAYILLCRDIELACDENVIRDLSTEQKKAYSSALLRCSVSRPMIAACPLAFGEVGVKERVKTVLNYKKPAFWFVVLAVILCAVVAVCFLTDPIPPDPSPDEQIDITEGAYVSQEKIYWAIHSSLYVEGMTMELADDTITLGYQGTGVGTATVHPLQRVWQDECPISDKRREILAELSNIEPAFAIEDLTGCRFLVIDETHFIVAKDEQLYLVSWRHSNIHLEMINYIFRMVPEAEYKDPVTIQLGTVTLETDPVEEAIYRYFMEMNSHKTAENTHTSVSFRNYGTAYDDPDYPGSITKYLNLRIAHYVQNEDGTITEEAAEMFPVVLSMNENENGSYEILDCVRDDADYSESNFQLETECWWQAYYHFEPDLQTQTAAVYADHAEYFSKDTTHGLDLLWWNTPEGVRCVILSGLQRARTSSDAAIHTPLTVAEAIAVLDYYDIPLQAMLTDSTSTLAIYHVDAP